MVGMGALPGWLARLLRFVLVGGGLFLAIAVGSTQAQAFSCPDTVGTPGIPTPFYFLTTTDCQKDTALSPSAAVSAVLVGDDGTSKLVQFDTTYPQFTVQSSVTTGANCTGGDSNITPPNTANFMVATAGIAACTTTITMTNGAVFTFTSNWNFAVSPFAQTSLTNVSFSPAGSATPPR